MLLSWPRPEPNMLTFWAGPAWIHSSQIILDPHDHIMPGSDWPKIARPILQDHVLQYIISIEFSFHQTCNENCEASMVLVMLGLTRKQPSIGVDWQKIIFKREGNSRSMLTWPNSIMKTKRCSMMTQYSVFFSQGKMMHVKNHSTLIFE